MKNLYIDMSSGASVTALINGIISSGCVQVDTLIENLNIRFGNFAKFSYQRMNQDGFRETKMIVNGHGQRQKTEKKYTKLTTRNTDQFGRQIIYDINVGALGSHDSVGHEQRTDNAKSLFYELQSLGPDHNRIAVRWPAKTQLIAAALISILKTYKSGKIIVLDVVKLSNGITYNLLDAWEQRMYLAPEESAALSAVVLFGEAVNSKVFESTLSTESKYIYDNKSYGDVKVYLIHEKDTLYKY